MCGSDLFSAGSYSRGSRGGYVVYIEWGKGRAVSARC